MNNISISQRLSAAVEDMNLISPKFYINTGLIIIKNNIINYQIITDVICLFLLPVLCIHVNENDYLLLGGLFEIFFLICLWNDFEAINIVRIDLLNRKISIHPRNPLKYLLKKDATINIDDINDFSITSTGSGRGQSRYKIKIKTKSNKAYLMTDFNDETDAERIKEILRSLFNEAEVKKGN